MLNKRKKIWCWFTKSKCPICKEYIHDMSNATSGFFQQPTHFHCIAERMGINELHQRILDLEKQRRNN